MNILCLTSGGDVGGAKTHILSLLHGLKQTDTVLLVCFTEGAFAEEARQLDIPTTVITDKNIVRAKNKVLQCAKEGGYELIHCHGARANMIGSLIRNKVGIPVITTVHSDYKLDYMGRPLGNLVYGTINRLALRTMDYYVGVSDHTTDILIARGFDPQKIYTVYNGVDFSERTPALTREEFLQQAGVQTDENTVIFGIAARINPVKDMTTLIQGFAQAQKKNPNIRLLIAGSGEEEEKLKALAERTCLKNTVTFLGWLKDTDSFYQALDVNMLTSVSEAFPYSLPEGARWHCATIATAVGGIPHFVDHAVNGYLFTPKDVDTLAAYMVELSTDREKRLGFGEKLYQKAREKFSAEATVSRQKEIYASVLQRVKRKTGKRDGVIICGAYGHGNVGDETLLSIIVSQLRSIDEDIPIYCLTRKPVETKQKLRIQAIKTFDLFTLFRKLGKSKLFISGGGTLIQDITSSRSLIYYIFTLQLAKMRGNRVMLYGCGIGPVQRKNNRRYSKRILNSCADVISVRDSYSSDYLKQLGVTKPKIVSTADPAINCECADDERMQSFLSSIGIDPEKNYLLVSVRSWGHSFEYLKEIAHSLSYAYQTYGLTPLLLEMEPKHDAVSVRQLAELLTCPYQIAGNASDGWQVVGLVKHTKLVLSMRLHGLIFAAGSGVNFVGIAYDPKVMAFANYLGEGSCLLLQDITAEKLNQKIDAAMQTPTLAEERVDVLKKLAQTNVELAKELLDAE